MGKLKCMAPRVGGMAPRVKALPKMAEAFYQSREWRALVAQRKRDHDYLLALSRCRRGERLILDHIVERKDGGADLDPSNTQWLTQTEHAKKTAKAKAARAAGQAPRSSAEASG